MRRRRALLVLLLLAVLVNLPLVHGAWTDHRVSADGTDVRATVVDTRTVGGQREVTFRLPEHLDPDQRVWRADVDAAAYAEAGSAGTLAVRVVPGDPAAQRVAGEAGSSILLVLTLLADLVLAAAALLAWRFAGRDLSGSGSRAPDPPAPPSGTSSPRRS